MRANLASNQIGSIPVTADFAGKPEKLAGHIYGDQGLAWVLISFNHVLNPFGGWPSLGLMVEYPKPDVVAAEL